MTLAKMIRVGTLLVAVIASPAMGSSKTFTTNFDNITTDPLGFGVPVPNPQDDLFFGLTAKNVGPLIPGTVTLGSKSPPNTAGRSQLGVLLNGNPPGNITSIYKGSKVKYFALKELYIGCGVASAGGVTSPTPLLPSQFLPEPCTLEFDGFRVGGARVNQTCDYAGLPVTRGGLALCVLDQKKFGDVKAVNISTLTALSTSKLTTLVTDDVVHENFY